MYETFYVTVWTKDNEPGTTWSQATSSYYYVLRFNQSKELLQWINQNKTAMFAVDIANTCAIDWS